MATIPGDGDGWEDAIDIDDSDLPSLLSPPPPVSLPSLRPCSRLCLPSAQTLNPACAAAPARSPDGPRPIPGPAGALQAAMIRRSGNGSYLNLEDDVGVGSIPNLDDEDFRMNPWLCAMRALGNDYASSSMSISSIKNCRRGIERVPQVVAIVKSCTPNGLGDLFINLKDPTGTIGASVNRRVLTEGSLGGDISVGCVLILKQVVVFCPTRAACYLNITLNNVVKLIGKDCGPPLGQVQPQLRARYAIFENHVATVLGGAEVASSVRQEGLNTNSGEVRRNSICERIMGNKTAGVLTRSGSYKVNSEGTANDAAPMADGNGREPQKLIIETSVAEQRDTPDSIANKRARITSNLTTTHGRKAQCLPSSSPCESNYTVPTTVPTVTIAELTDNGANEPKKPILEGSVAQWTDEQLAELFADYQDDYGFAY